MGFVADEALCEDDVGMRERHLDEGWCFTRFVQSFAVGRHCDAFCLELDGPIVKLRLWCDVKA